MKLTIIHVGGSEKTVEFESFDAPRPWIRVRYPKGAGIFSFALAHGAIEHKRGESPQWFLAEDDLEKLRVAAREARIMFSPVPKNHAVSQLRPRRPRKKTDQKQLDLFGGRASRES
jgi:hypothetical protein